MRIEQGERGSNALREKRTGSGAFRNLLQIGDICVFLIFQMNRVRSGLPGLIAAPFGSAFSDVRRKKMR